MHLTYEQFSASTPMLLDNRVGSIDLEKTLRNLGVKVETGRLLFGDMAWEGKGPKGRQLSIGVERKKLRDMVNSMREGRLSGHQVPGMCDVYDVRYLIVEGVWRVGEDGKLYWPERGGMVEARLGGRGVWVSEVMGWCGSVMEQAGFRVVRTGSAVETAYWLQTMWKWWQKEWEEHTALGLGGVGGALVGGKMETTGVLNTQKPNLVWRMAAQIDGIGVKRGRDVSKVFKSPREMVNATAREWAKVKGIGKGTAEKVVRWMEMGTGR